MMRASFIRWCFVLLLGLFLPFSSPASVSLSLSDGNGSATVAPGGSFSVNLYLTTTANEPVIGLDYYLSISGAASGFVSLTGRDLTGSAFPDVFLPDATILAASSALLDPTNGDDLGGFIPDILTPLTTGTYLVAQFTFNVNALAPMGTYSLMTYNPPDTGWAGLVGDSVITVPFDSAGLFSLTISAVPEPSTWALAVLGMGTLVFAFRRRKFSVVV